LQRVADTLNAEGWRPAGRRETFTVSMVNSLLSSKEPDHGKHTSKPSPQELDANEWTVPALAHRLGMSRLTLYAWVKRGWVQARKVPSAHPHGVWIIRADEQELARLAALRPAQHWPRRPPPR